MTDSECDNTFSTLSKYLTKHGLEWVVDAVLQDISAGEDVEVRVRVYHEPRKDSIENRRDGSKPVESRYQAYFMQTRKYTSKDRLRLLLDAIERNVVNTVEMESYTLEALSELSSKRTDKKEDIRFISSSDKEGNHTIDRQKMPARQRQASKLRILLNELRQEIDSAD